MDEAEIKLARGGSGGSGNERSKCFEAVVMRVLFKVGDGGSECYEVVRVLFKVEAEMKVVNATRRHC